MKLKSKERLFKISEKPFYRARYGPYIAFWEINVFRGYETLHELVDFALNTDQPVDSLGLNPFHAFYVCYRGLDTFLKKKITSKLFQYWLLSFYGFLIS